MATRNLWPHTVSVLLALSGSDSATEVQAAGLSLSGTGITFPDASVQQTAPFPPLPARMVWVAKADGDYVSPVDAMNDLATWCPLRSETNPCVMLIAPGLYDLGDQSVHTVDWVGIVGSGRDATVLRGGGSPDRCVVSDEGTAGESTMVLKDLTVAATVNSTSNDACAVGTRNENGSSIRLERVSATASAEQGGTNRGIYNSFSTYDATNRPVLKQVVARARGAGATNHGIYNGNAAPLMQGVLATAEEGSSNYGVTNNNSTPTIQASHLEGGTAGLVISALPTGGTVTGTYVTDTMIQGGVTDNDGSTNCRNTYSVVTSVIEDVGC